MPAPPFNARGRRRRRFSRLGSPCQELLLKEVLDTVPNPSGPGGGGFLRKAISCVNRAFQPFHKPENRSLQSAKNRPRKPHWLPRFVTEAVRMKRGDYSEPTREARSFYPPTSPRNPGDLRPQRPRRPARLRARWRYTEAAPGPQAAFSRQTQILAESRSVIAVG